MNIQHPVNQVFPAPCIELAHPRILSIPTIANHSIVFFNEWEKLLKVPNIELPVRVHKKSKFLRRRCKSTHQGSTITLVGWMSDETNSGVIVSKCCNNFTSSIRTPIVDNQNLKIYAPCVQHKQN